jgi:hypothetical protein
MPAAEPTALEPPLKSTGPASPYCDSFSKGPWIAALCLWVVAVLPPIFLGLGGLLPSPWLLLSIFAVAAVVMVGLVLLIVNLFLRRWRTAVSMILACAAFASATLSSLKFHDQLRWYALRPYYVAQVAASPITPDGIHGIWWDGGSDWDVRLEYHETESDARAWQQKQQGWLGSCKRSLNEIEPHYFLNSVYC